MASFTGHPDPQKFPLGTKVKLYAAPKTPWSQTGQPPGAEVAEAEVTEVEGALTLKYEGLTEGAKYLGWSQRSGIDYYLNVTANVAAASGGISKAEAEALIAEKAVSTVSPAFTGTPTAPTASAGTNTTQLSTTAFTTGAIATEKTAREAADSTLTTNVATAKTEVGTEKSRAETAEALKAPLASPALTGTPTAPTATGSTNTTQLATTAFVQALVSSSIEGLNAHPNVLLATAAALPANAYLTGVLTGSAVGALTVDGTAVAVGNRLLVKNEVAEANNGLYVVTKAGGVAEVYVLTRAADMNEATEVPGAFVFAEGGTTNKNNGFFVASPGPFTIGTTAIVWSQFTGSGDLVAGSGITLTGNTVSVTKATLRTIVRRSIAIGAGQVPANEVVLDEYVKIESGETRKILWVEVHTTSGTIKVKFQRGEAGTTEISAYNALAATSSIGLTSSTVSLADKDRLRVTLAEGSSPKGLSITWGEEVVAP